MHDACILYEQATGQALDARASVIAALATTEAWGSEEDVQGGGGERMGSVAARMRSAAALCARERNLPVAVALLQLSLARQQSRKWPLPHAQRGQPGSLRRHDTPAGPR